MAKKKKNKFLRFISWSLLFFIILTWIALPLFAGLFAVGEPDGPKIYPVKMHEYFYRIGYAAAGRGTARKSLSSYFYERPWFYFLHTRSIPKAEGERVINSTKEWVDEKYHDLTD